VAPEIMTGEKHYGKSCDVFSFAFTVLAWASKSAKMSAVLNEQIDEWKGIKREEGHAPVDNAARVCHNVVVAGWRPSNEWMEKELKIPSTIVGLLSIMWVNNPDERPSFNEIEQ
jgi:hypothetical protein